MPRFGTRVVKVEFWVDNATSYPPSGKRWPLTCQRSVSFQDTRRNCQGLKSWTISPCILKKNTPLASQRPTFGTFLRMRLCTYASTFSRMDWLSHLCILTHPSFHLCIYFLMYGWILSPMLCHTCAFSPMNLISQLKFFWLTYAISLEPFHPWIYFLTYGLTFSPTHAPFHLCIYFLTYGCTYSFQQSDWTDSYDVIKATSINWLFHLCFFTHAPFHLWIYFLTYGLTVLPMLSHAWAFLPMHILSHVWIDSLTYPLSLLRLFTYASTFSHMDWLSLLCFLFLLWIYFLT